MDDCWRALSIFLPSHLAGSELVEELRARVIAVAIEGGDFVRRIRITGRRVHSEDWVHWQAAYLSGPAVIGRYLPQSANVLEMEGD